MFVTTLEALWVRCHLAEPIRVGKRNVCPFLQEARCAIRPFRPLGCRLFFCDMSWADESSALYEKYMKRLRDIEQACGMAHEYMPWPDALYQVGVASPAGTFAQEPIRPRR